MAKVYLVTEGDYSDFHICAAFSTEEKAERYKAECDKFNRSTDWAKIEEWELDEQDDIILRNSYYAKVCLETGEVVASDQPDTTLAPAHARSDRREQEQQFPYADVQMGGHCISVTSYESREHAIKLAAETRQAFLRKLDANGGVAVLTKPVSPRIPT